MITDKEMMLEVVDIVRTIADHEKGLKRHIGKLVNKINYLFYKWI